MVRVEPLLVLTTVLGAASTPVMDAQLEAPPAAAGQPVGKEKKGYIVTVEDPVGTTIA